MSAGISVDSNESCWLGYIIIYPLITTCVFLFLPPAAGMAFGAEALAPAYWIIWTLFWTVIGGRTMVSMLKATFNQSLGRIGDWLLRYLILAMTALPSALVVSATGVVELTTAAGFATYLAISMTAFVTIEMIPWLNKRIDRHFG